MQGIIQSNSADLKTEEISVGAWLGGAITNQYSSKVSTLSQGIVGGAIHFVAGMFVGKMLHKWLESQNKTFLTFGA
jgi:hypothetical protein